MCAKNPTLLRTALQQIIIQHKVSIVLKLRNPALEECFSNTRHQHPEGFLAFVLSSCTLMVSNWLGRLSLRPETSFLSTQVKEMLPVQGLHVENNLAEQTFPGPWFLLLTAPSPGTEHGRVQSLTFLTFEQDTHTSCPHEVISVPHTEK